MKRFVVFSAAIAGALMPLGARAMEHPSPGGGPEFGQHVASMAPEHPREHGRMFGQCVSAMARGEDCPHHGE